MPADWGAAQPWVIGPTREGPGAAIAFVQVSGLFSDPCLDNQGSPDVAVGSTAAELASALAEHEAYEATATGDFTVDGYEGIRMELVMPSDLDYTTCQLDSSGSGTSRSSPGSPPAGISGSSTSTARRPWCWRKSSDAPAEDLDQIEGLVQSIQIHP